MISSYNCSFCRDTGCNKCKPEMFEKDKKMLETKEDKAEERKAQKILTEKWGCTFYSLGKYSAVDWIMHIDKKIVAVAEFKRIYHDLRKYPLAKLNFTKWLGLTFVGMGLQVPGFFVAQYDDEFAYINVKDIDPRITEVVGRTDRNRKADKQPCISFPHEHMTVIK